jgi:carbon-monoxide dehydrogenase iron sulfur subunit
MAKLLFINTEKCVACMSCVLACSLQHGDAIGPTHSRILPVRLKKQAVHVPVVCRQCLKPYCAEVCPMGAISRNEKTRAMIVDAVLCIGCGMCMTACPLGGINVQTEAGHAVKCDLCEGDPLCVKFCGYGAIEYITEEEAAFKSKKEAIGKLGELLTVLAAPTGSGG